jgi:hypothetical protein
MDPWPFYQFVQDMYPRARLVRIVWEAGTFNQALYQTNLLMGVYCRFYGDLATNEANCSNFWDALSAGNINPPLWTGPCCKYQNARIREYFYPHLGAYTAWPELTYNSSVAPFTLVRYGLQELVVAASTCPRQPQPPPQPSPQPQPTESSSSMSSGVAAVVALLSIMTAGLLVASIILYQRLRLAVGVSRGEARSAPYMLMNE